MNYIFGAGFYGRYAFHLLKKRGITVDAYVVSDTLNNPETVLGIPVKDISELKIDSDNKIYIGVSETRVEEIKKMLLHIGFFDIETLDFPSLEYLSFSDMSYKDYLSMWYEIYKGESISWKNPESFNEKIQWIKLYGITPLIKELTDKYSVREWVKNKIGEEYLVPIYGCWNCFDEIDFSTLPNKFVLKCNHGCGYNYIVNNKENFDLKDAKEKFDIWMKTDYGYSYGLELQYHDIKPRIIAEQYLENVNDDLYDYKFWCFNGKVEFVMFLSERAKVLKMNNYDLNWNILPFTYNYKNTNYNVERPLNLSKMVSIAEKLSSEFKFVRVDLYHLNDGTIKFGEMTFTPASGICEWSDEGINKQLGSKIFLDV